MSIGITIIERFSERLTEEAKRGTAEQAAAFSRALAILDDEITRARKEVDHQRDVMKKVIDEAVKP